MEQVQLSKSVMSLLTVTLCSTLALVGCGAGGANSLVKNASVQATTVNNEVFAQVTLDISTGNIVLPSFRFPILDPKNPGVELGSIGLQPVLLGSSSTEIIASVNLTRVAKVNGSDGHMLPNGTPIPVGGLSSIPVIAIPVGGDGIIVYVALATNTAVIGAAIPIQEFSAIGQYVGGLNFFPSFDFGNARGIAGIYTSPPSVGENGLALFVDASKAIQQTPFNSTVLASAAPSSGLSSGLAGARVSALAAASVAPVTLAPQPTLSFKGTTPSRSKQRRVANVLYYLGHDMGGAPVSIGK